ncbi:hypothetical protein SRABI106_04726 [Rahnella aquatilis]|nr:hypothetical protein SRABI106_04726 [Rahnella aquatilis]
METGNRPAGDSDKQEREQAAGEYRAAAVNKARNRWHFHLWHSKDDTDRQPDNDAYFQER